MGRIVVTATTVEPGDAFRRLGTVEPWGQTISESITLPVPYLGGGARDRSGQRFFDGGEFCGVRQPTCVSVAFFRSSSRDSERGAQKRSRAIEIHEN